MTFSQFKDELELVRDNRRQIRCLIESGIAIANERLVSIGVTDYSKDRVQSSKDPDNGMINRIERNRIEDETRKKQIDKLKSEIEWAERLILDCRGDGGAILYLYYIDGHTMEKVSAITKFELTYCYELRRKTLRNIYEKEVSKK